MTTSPHEKAHPPRIAYLFLILRPDVHTERDALALFAILAFSTAGMESSSVTIFLKRVIIAGKTFHNCVHF
ncbi:hypothetical protein [Desulfovibrio legallii]|uniref:hypothetical protein n=1 Tax=Desulfovibrio legallii TaxID=571438 RepID=UPI001177D000|nr:hypothetical protein [Desulfovibrio legallii]